MSSNRYMWWRVWMDASFSIVGQMQDIHKIISIFKFFLKMLFSFHYCLKLETQLEKKNWNKSNMPRDQRQQNSTFLKILSLFMELYQLRKMKKFLILLNIFIKDILHWYLISIVFWNKGNIVIMWLVVKIS